MDNARISVGNGVKLSLHVDLGIALSSAARCDDTLVRAGTTLDLPVGQRGIEISFFNMAIGQRKSLVSPYIVPWKCQGTAGGAKCCLYKIAARCFHSTISRLLSVKALTDTLYPHVFANPLSGMRCLLPVTDIQS